MSIIGDSGERDELRRWLMLDAVRLREWPFAEAVLTESEVRWLVFGRLEGGG